MFIVDMIYGVYYWGFYCLTPVLWFVLYILLRRRLKPRFLIPLFAIVPIALIGMLRATEESAMALAETLTISHIQQALDDQCPNLNHIADHRLYRYTIDFGRWYSNSSISLMCVYEREWICECD
jgi:hypothetical protein